MLTSKPSIPKSRAACEGPKTRIAISALTASCYCAEIARTIGLNLVSVCVSLPALFVPKGQAGISERLSPATI